MVYNVLALCLWYVKQYPPGGGGGNLVSTMPVSVCQKVKDMGPFSALSQ